MVVTERAPAKLNLYLHIVGKRADGYHLLDSLVAFADVADVVTAAPADELSLALDGPFAATLAADSATNLVSRAADVLQQRIGSRGAHLALTKTLPVASGIGGGSSDAAATLRALVALWQVKISHDELHALALRLGADVPVCLDRQAAWMGGIGEEVSPAPKLPRAGVVLVNPGVAVATADVFKRRDGPFSEPARFTAAPRDVAHLAALLAERRNDLTPAALGLAPVIAEVLSELAVTTGAHVARMSGSGATCFALYDDLVQAEAAARGLSAAHATWWVKAATLL